MTLAQIRTLARKFNNKPRDIKKEELIRTIQHAERNVSCFNTNYSALCGQYHCAWRDDCDRD